MLLKPISDLQLRKGTVFKCEHISMCVNIKGVAAAHYAFNVHMAEMFSSRLHWKHNTGTHQEIKLQKEQQNMNLLWSSLPREGSTK